MGETECYKAYEGFERDKDQGTKKSQVLAPAISYQCQSKDRINDGSRRKVDVPVEPSNKGDRHIWGNLGKSTGLEGIRTSKAICKKPLGGKHVVGLCVCNVENQNQDPQGDPLAFLTSPP